jgi:hypothetical protein
MLMLMTINKLSVHVATTTRKVGDKVYHSHLLRHSFRENGKVRNVTVANLSMLPEPVIEAIRMGLKGTAVGPVEGGFETLDAWPHGHVAAVVGTMRKLGVDRLFAARPSREKSIALALVAGRVIHPGSKLSLSRHCLPEARLSTLGQVLEVEGVTENEFYQAMDWLLERQAKIEDALAKRHLTGGCLVLYDVSSSYFEGKTCPLAQYGHSRDHRPDRLQIVYGLLCNAEGCPVAIEVFEGKTGDPKTVASQVKKLKERFGLERVVLVGDRGMITEARIEKDVEPAGLDYLTALRGPAIEKLCAAKVLTPSLFDARNLAEVTHPDFPGERLIACFNPFTKEQRERQRGELLEKADEALRKVFRACIRKAKPLRGQGVIGLEVGKALSSAGMAKYYRIEVREDGFSWRRNQALIAYEAAADGLYVIRTKVPEQALKAEDAKAAYHSLSHVEWAFRSLKGMDLQIRPIHHRLEDRVRAHVFLCMLGYYVEWHLRKAWEPLLFDGEPQCVPNGKRRTKRTPEGLPVMGFRDLLQDLAGLTRNRVRFAGASATVTLYATPTPLQQKAFDLLGLSPIV